MNEFLFEIFRRNVDRYSWRLVASDGERRVLARASRDYKSVKKARKAVYALKRAVKTADVGYVTSGVYGPVAEFEIVGDVFPLRVGTFTSGRATVAARRPRARAAYRRSGTAVTDGHPAAPTGYPAAPASDAPEQETDAAPLPAPAAAVATKTAATKTARKRATPTATGRPASDARPRKTTRS
jgi:uncharacterized protein YegP (UPF0339 family)